MHTIRSAGHLRSPIGLCLLDRLARAGDGAAQGRADATSVFLTALRCDMELSPWAADCRAQVDALLARADELRPFAELLVQTEVGAMLWADMSRSRQVWVARDSTAPEESRLEVDVRQLAETAI